MSGCFQNFSTQYSCDNLSPIGKCTWCYTQSDGHGYIGRHFDNYNTGCCVPNPHNSIIIRCSCPVPSPAKKLSGGQIAGIVAGSVVFIIILSLLARFVFKRYFVRNRAANISMEFEQQTTGYHQN
jgi:hypothetical protein